MSQLPTSRHVSYALGYLGLGMFRQAAAELQRITEGERDRPDVQSAWVDLHMATRKWTRVIAVAGTLARAHAHIESGWIGWAYALRELERIAEARDVLLEAEAHHGGTSAVLHYNLACYDSLLGDLLSAHRRLATACRMDERLKTDGATDPDLRALRESRATKRRGE